MTIDHATIRRFREVMRRFERASQCHLRACCHGVSLPQCHILLAIDVAGKTNATDLARHLGLDISTISRTVDSLVKAGLADRLAHPRDRRLTMLRLTGEGKRVCRSINRGADAFFTDVVTRIPQTKRKNVLENFAVVVNAFVRCQQNATVSPSCCASATVRGNPGGR